MERNYTVKKGDTLSQIARNFGLGPDGHKQIADHADNQSLFGDKLRNEFRINPGDKLVIPAIVVAQHSVKTNQKVTFKTQSRKGFFSFKPLDANGVALTQFKYEIILGDLEEQGDESTNGGLIQGTLPSRFEKTKKESKKEGRIVKYWPDNLSDEERNSKSAEELKEHNKGIIKLFSNPKDSDEYQILNINLGLESEDSIIGIKQCLANDLKLFCDIDNDSNNQSGKLEDDDVHQMVSDEVKHVASLPPMTSIVNLRPDYYPVVWQFYRYGRIVEIVKRKYEELDEKLTEAKENNDSFSIMEFINGEEENEAYDALAIRTEKSRMDVAYYQYCFIRWGKEFERIWDAHQPNSNPVEVILQSRQHGAMAESLKLLVNDWEEEFSSHDNVQSLLDLKFEPIAYPPQEYDVYSPIYNAKNIQDQLSTHMVSIPLTSRVRFCYKDDAEQVIANSYVIYWRYDKSGKDIEKGREAYYQKASIMMPVGIGKTDSEGYLVQSIPFSDLYHNGYMHVEDNKFAMQSGWGFKDGKIDDSFVPSHDNYADLIDLKDEVKSLKIPEGPWDEMVARVNKNFPEYSEGGDFDWRHISIGSSMHTNAVENSENYAELHESLAELRKEFPNHYRELRTTSSNHLFNHYSSGQQDTYGFMVYPPDGGLFQTADLAKLGTDGEFAYKGPVNAPNDQKNPIELHCTLQEWERRLKVLNIGIKKDIDDYYSGTSSHRENTANISRMEGLLDIHNRYPYEKVSPAALGEKKKLAEALEQLSSGVKDRLINPDPSSDEDAHIALSSMKVYTDKLVSILSSDDFKKEYILHRDAEIDEEPAPSPYMQVNETWRSIYSTIADSLELLGSTPWANNVYNKLLDHPLKSLASSKVVEDILKRNQNEIFNGETDKLVINKDSDVFEETQDFLNHRYDEYEKHSEVVPETLLGEILANEKYQNAKLIKETLDTLIHKAPGPNSVLMVVLDAYDSFIQKEMLSGKELKGFHVRILVAAFNSFGFFSGNKSMPEGTLLSILRTNEALRNDARLILKKKIFSDLKESMGGKKHSKIILKKIKSLRLKKQIEAAKSANRTALLKELNKRESTLSDEVYAQAKGNVASLYKTSLHLMSVVQLAEDIQKSVRIGQQQHVDIDLVMMNWIKTTSGGGVIAANSMILANRWFEGLSKSGGFLNETGKFSFDYIDKIANRLAIAGGLISLYISTRETVSLWDHKDGVEQVDACLGLLSNALLLAGTLAPTKVGEFLGRFFLLAWFPGAGQLLMILGALVVVAQISIAIYQNIRNKSYLDNHPVGFYFWQEFKELQDSGQAYYDDDYVRPGMQNEEKGYKKILEFQCNEFEYLGQEQPGWGHLSWRAAVPLYLLWRKRDSSDQRLIESIEHMTGIPHVHIKRTVSHESALAKFEETEHLITGEGFIKFYTFMEAAVASGTKKEAVFNCSNKTYYTIMGELSSGKYIPQGETDEVIELFSQLETGEYDELDGSGWDNFWRGATENNTNRFIHWDHSHFKLLASKTGLVEKGEYPESHENINI